MKNKNSCTELDSQKATRLWLTVELASALRLHAETIRRAIREGRIKAQKVGRSWRISDDVVSRLVREGFE